MSRKNLIFGEKIPDKDAPKYKERYEKEVEAGRKFARVTRIDKAAAVVQHFANEHRNLFLAIVFGTVICCFTFNIYRIAVVWNASHQNQTTATQKQQTTLDRLHGKDRKIKQLEIKYEKLLKEKADRENKMNTNNKPNIGKNEHQEH